MARNSSPLLLVALVCSAALAVTLLVGAGPSFIPSSAPKSWASSDVVLRLTAVGAATPALGAPLAAFAQEPIAEAGTPIPEPVLGIGFLSVIVVIVLIISGFVVARGLLDDEVGGEL
eukprot:CAMPEP_0172665906 /NCGR_PEP_ID=MMETSP1074-20121228/7515_1 /TAXON_ID=2916 /ORGANISM="Ceratium fusus, Strain PA161109" /LENGTH=116 /DNA_ID=CAMNT_0013482257 /DNA_START=56 /DNA_END=406 /DNA_ORIENTATION=+